MRTFFGVSLSIVIIAAQVIFPQSIGWQKKESGTSVRLNSITMQKDNCWIVGNDGTVLLRDEKNGQYYYRSISFNSTKNLNKIKFTLSDFGLAAGDSGIIGIITSSNAGPRIGLIQSGTAENLQDIAYTNNDSTVIIVGNHGTILRSRTDTVNFRVVAEHKDYDLNSVSFTRNGIGWAAGTNGTIVKSYDGGETWESQTSNTSNNFTMVSFFDSENGWAADDKGTVLYTSDGGNVWVESPNKAKNKIIGGYFPPKEIVSSIKTTGGGERQDLQRIRSLTADSKGMLYFYYQYTSIGMGVKYLDSSGYLSDYAPPGPETFMTDLKFNQGDTLFGLRNLFGLFYYPKKGARPSTWAVLPDRGTKLFCFDFDPSQNIWAGGDNKDIYCISDQKKITSFPFNHNVLRIKVHEDYLYASIRSTDSADAIWRFKIFSSDSLGAPELFLNMGNLTTKMPAKIFDFVFDGENNLLLCSNLPDAIDIIHADKTIEPALKNYYPALNSSDFDIANLCFAGKTGKDLYLSFITKADPNTLEILSDIYRISLNPLVDFPGWMVGERGEILKKDGDKTTWSAQYSGTNLDLNAVEFINDSTGIAVGDSGLILETTNGGITTGVDQSFNNHVASNYKLYQNYPNPFNPQTSFEYYLPKTSYVKIKVYNLLGQLVATLIDKEQASGNHNVQWTAANFASGIYIYSIHSAAEDGSGEFRDSKKMILLK